MGIGTTIELMKTILKTLLVTPLLFGTVACASSDFVGKNKNGYEFRFNKENVTTVIETQSRNTYNESTDINYLNNKVPVVRVQANGTVTSMNGEVEHYSNSRICVIEAHKQYRHVKYLKLQITRIDPNDYVNRVKSQHEMNSTYEDYKILAQEAKNDPTLVVTPHGGFTHKVRKSDSIQVEAEYVNENSLICQAAKKFKMI